MRFIMLVLVFAICDWSFFMQRFSVSVCHPRQLITSNETPVDVWIMMAMQAKLQDRYIKHKKICLRPKKGIFENTIDCLHLFRVCFHQAACETKYSFGCYPASCALLYLILPLLIVELLLTIASLLSQEHMVQKGFTFIRKKIKWNHGILREGYE